MIRWTGLAPREFEFIAAGEPFGSTKVYLWVCDRERVREGESVCERERE